MACIAPNAMNLNGKTIIGLIWSNFAMVFLAKAND